MTDLEPRLNHDYDCERPIGMSHTDCCCSCHAHESRIDIERLRWAFDRLGLSSYLPERAPLSRLGLWFAIDREYDDLRREFG